jgi:hypothetical protein
MQKYSTSRNSSMGAISVELMPSLMPTMPYSSASATRQGRRCHLGRLVLALEAVERGDQAERLLLGDDHVGRHIGQHGRLEEAAAPPSH